MMERDFAKDVVRQSYRPLNLLQNTTQLMNLLMKHFPMNQILKEKQYMKVIYINAQIAAKYYKRL